MCSGNQWSDSAYRVFFSVHMCSVLRLVDGGMPRAARQNMTPPDYQIIKWPRPHQSKCGANGGSPTHKEPSQALHGKSMSQTLNPLCQQPLALVRASGLDTSTQPAQCEFYICRPIGTRAVPQPATIICHICTCCAVVYLVCTVRSQTRLPRLGLPNANNNSNRNHSLSIRRAGKGPGAHTSLVPTSPLMLLCLLPAMLPLLALLILFPCTATSMLCRLPCCCCLYPTALHTDQPSWPDVSVSHCCCKVCIRTCMEKSIQYHLRIMISDRHIALHIPHHLKSTGAHTAGRTKAALGQNSETDTRCTTSIHAHLDYTPIQHLALPP